MTRSVKMMRHIPISWMKTENTLDSDSNLNTMHTLGSYISHT